MGVLGRLSRASQLLDRELRTFFAGHGLQPGEFDILATLRRAGTPHRLSAGALAESSMVTSGAITNRIDRLVAKGYVTRETDPENRRSVLITLTDAGRALVDAVAGAHLENERRLLGPLTAAQQDQLAGLLRRLLAGLGDV
ncbi:MarR family transcriptional regulator [Georgenia thermotolerans]|uniref:MarR family transcriptional regulator n=2 Tax=Georgenia thermotolerans TaxID=527326 RepID=A0A7J5UL50_9MICO|nr:MarR family transcriptional regulator [Georgenia thermotolerans]